MDRLTRWEPIPVYLLGDVPPVWSQAVYHGLAELGREGLIIVSPSRPYVSVGYFQDAVASVDLDYCRGAGLPVVRRMVGGGAVLLDGGQVFYQLVFKRGRPGLPGDIDGLYNVLSAAPVEAYRRLGVEVRRRPVNDLVTAEGKKIAGQGGAEIGPSLVFVGSIIVRFDYETMVRALRVPDEKFRDKLYHSLRDNLTTLERELTRKDTAAPPPLPTRSEVEQALIAGFAPFPGRSGSPDAGPAVRTGLDPDEEAAVRRMESLLGSEQFLLDGRPGERGPRERAVGAGPAGSPAVKVREGVRVGLAHYKAPGGLITATVEVVDGKVASLALAGDFALRPAAALAVLEAGAAGKVPERETLTAAFAEAIARSGADIPGVEAADLAEATYLAALGGRGGPQGGADQR